MKKITITIEHELTPFHTESMEGMLRACLVSLDRYWQEKSVKKFNITSQYED